MPPAAPALRRWITDLRSGASPAARGPASDHVSGSVSAPNLTSSRKAASVSADGRPDLWRPFAAKFAPPLRPSLRVGSASVGPGREVPASTSVLGRAPTARSPRAPCGPPGAGPPSTRPYPNVSPHRGAPLRMSPRPPARALADEITPAIRRAPTADTPRNAPEETFTVGRLARGRHSPAGASRDPPGAGRRSRAPANRTDPKQSPQRTARNGRDRGPSERTDRSPATPAWARAPQEGPTS